MGCKAVSPVPPQLTITPAQQMHSEWNTKWKQWFDCTTPDTKQIKQATKWIYHTKLLQNKKFCTNFLCLPTMSATVSYLSHFITPYINSHILHMHAPNTYTHTCTHITEQWRTQSDSNSRYLNPQALVFMNWTTVKHKCYPPHID